MQGIVSPESFTQNRRPPIIPRSNKCGFCREIGHTISNCRHPDTQRIAEEIIQYCLSILRNPYFSREEQMNRLKLYLDNTTTIHLKVAVKSVRGVISKSRRELIEFLIHDVTTRFSPYQGNPEEFIWLSVEDANQLLYSSVSNFLQRFLNVEPRSSFVNYISGIVIQAFILRNTYIFELPRHLLKNQIERILSNLSLTSTLFRRVSQQDFQDNERINTIETGNQSEVIHLDVERTEEPTRERGGGREGGTSLNATGRNNPNVFRRHHVRRHRYPIRRAERETTPNVDLIPYVIIRGNNDIYEEKEEERLFEENWGHNCCICLDCNECEKDAYVKTNCKHDICFECLQDWIPFSYKKHTLMKCPVCRTSINELFAKNDVIFQQLQYFHRFNRLNV